MPPLFPLPDMRFPILLPDGTPHRGLVFLKAAIDHPQITVGDYSYASAHAEPDDWAARLAPYLYPFSPERLTIGRFCQIADGVTFITASANHRHDGFSTFPFAIFGGPKGARPSMPGPGPDTRIGHDVWLGQGATILPGTTIGNGVIVGAKAVVGGTVPDYAIVAGNPARIVRMRFDVKVIESLLVLAWWHWPIDLILRNEAAICDGDLGTLERAAPG